MRKIENSVKVEEKREIKYGLKNINTYLKFKKRVHESKKN